MSVVQQLRPGPHPFQRHLPQAVRDIEVPRATLGKLRPVKVRNAARRRWFERRMATLQLHAMRGLALLGSDYGGWIVPAGEIDGGWVCYSVGAGGDVSFDLELVRRGAKVRSFDAVAEFVEAAISEAAGADGFSAHHAALATSDGPLLMQRSHDPASRSVSSAGLYESSSFVELPGRTLASLMGELGDERIDLLKLDVEGAEYGILPTLDLRELGARVFGVQLHHSGSVGEARALVRRLRAQRYEPVACREAVRITFVRGDLL